MDGGGRHVISFANAWMVRPLLRYAAALGVVSRPAVWQRRGIELGLVWIGFHASDLLCLRPELHDQVSGRVHHALKDRQLKLQKVDRQN